MKARFGDLYLMTRPSNIDYGLRQFAVLHHTGVDHAHYDFMFDTADDSQLVTFRVVEWPLMGSQSASKLRDHRRAYLNFQGAIPGDRGQVHRTDEGKVHVIKTVSGWLLHHASGNPWLLLEPPENGSENAENWWMTRLDNPTAG